MVKYIIILLLAVSIYPQSQLLLQMDSGVKIYTYDGSELITNSIDRTFEPVSVYQSNFSDGVDSWSLVAGAAMDGNIDSDGLTDLLRVRTNNTTISFRRTINFSENNKTVISYQYFVPDSAATNGHAITGYSTGGILGNTAVTKNQWISNKVNFIPTATHGDAARFYIYSATAAEELWYLSYVRVSTLPTYTNNGNHSIDSSSTYKQANSYSGKIVATAAGNGTTNTISLASTLFTAVTAGTHYRFQLYAYTTTASTTLNFKLGDIELSALVDETGMAVINFDFKATASTTGNILLYLDKAATVYIDEVSLKSGS